MIRMLKYACAVITAGVMIGCSSDKNITIDHPEIVEADQTFDVILTNFFVYGTTPDLAMPAFNPGANRDSLRVVAGLPSDWQVLGAACYAAKDFNIATQLRNAQSIDTQALYDTLKTYISKLQPMEADPVSETSILGKKEIQAHNSANKATRKIKPSDIKKWVAFKGAVDITIDANSKQDTVLPIETLLKIASLLGVDTATLIPASYKTLMSQLNVKNVGFSIKPIVTILKVKAPQSPAQDTLYYFSRSTSLDSSSGSLDQDLGDMTFVPVSVVATPVKRLSAAMQHSNYTMQSSNGSIRIVFANSRSNQYAELFRVNGSFVGKAVASHGLAQFDKHALESSGSGFVKITNGSSVSVEKLRVVK